MIGNTAAVPASGVEAVVRSSTNMASAKITAVVVHTRVPLSTGGIIWYRQELGYTNALMPYGGSALRDEDALASYLWSCNVS